MAFELIPEARRVAQSGREATIPADISLPATRCLFCAGRDHVLAWEAVHAGPFFRPGVRREGLLVLYLVCPFVWVFLLPLAMLSYFGTRPVLRLTLPRCGPCGDRSTTARIVGTAATVLLGLLVPAGAWGLGTWSGGIEVSERSVTLIVPNAAATSEALAAMAEPNP
jgi:hypothetical protein